MSSPTRVTNGPYLPIALAIAVPSFIVAIGWSVDQIGNESFGPALTLFSLCAPVVLLALLGLCFLLVRALRLRRAVHYIWIMFAVAGVANAIATYRGLHVYTEFQSGPTVLVHSGELTPAGIASLLESSLLNGLLLSIGVAVGL